MSAISIVIISRSFMPTSTSIIGGLMASDALLERLFEVMAKPVMLSVRQLVALRERARILERWSEVEKLTEQLWALGYYN